MANTKTENIHQENEKRKAASTLWLMNKHYQTVLRATRTIAFEYDSKNKIEYVSPFIDEYLAGNYDGRPLSVVMLEDGVIFPDDVELAVQFREKVQEGGGGEVTLRLMTPLGDYKWYKMILSPCEDEEREGLFVGVLIDVDAEVRQNEILRYRAEYDPISGIYNKQAFFEKAKKILESDPDTLHFIVRFDIDRFKMINELYSVTEGDKVLQYIGAALREICSQEEIFARLGNDVFCICLTRTEPEMLEVIRHLEKKIDEYPINFQFVLSIGILRVPHYNGQAVDLMCDQAAMAQRTVKGNYVIRYAFYDPAMGEELNREHYIAGYMRRALDNGEFIVYFQPKYEIESGKMIGAEALVRWNHPVSGMIPPGEFIPLFEKNGFILPLDEYVWEQTCGLMRNWEDQGLELVPVSMNVSRLHMHDPEFCDKIQRLSEKYGLSPYMMEMEITESAYIESPQTLYCIMDRLQQNGFVFSMDDFGSGYSSLNILKDIPVDTVKIDLNFLKEARRGPEAGRAVVEGTIRLVREMGLPIIAEGVETREQVELLLKAGCTGAQGYYYSRPMPAADFEKLLIRRKEKSG